MVYGCPTRTSGIAVGHHSVPDIQSTLTVESGDDRLPASKSSGYYGPLASTRNGQASSAIRIQTAAQPWNDRRTR